MRRRAFIAGLGSVAAWPLAVRAQPAERVRRVGVLTAGNLYATLSLSAFRDEITKLGWVEGQSLRIDYRASGADRDHLAADAEELAALRPDVILALTGAAVRAARLRTRTIPIVFVGGGDPRENNLVDGIAHPTGNVTGFANNFVSLGGKWLELLKQAAPRLTRVARVFDQQLSLGGASPIKDAIDAAAAQLAITTISMPVSNPDETARAIDAFAAEPNGGLLVTGPHSDGNIKTILGLALQHRLPTMFGAGKLVAAPSPAAIAAKAATATIPIVFTSGFDAVRIGLVASLNRPGGNITGASLFSGVLSAKRLQLARELVPDATLIALLVNPTNENAQADTADLKETSRAIGQDLVIVEASNEKNLDLAFVTIVQRRAAALIVGTDAFFYSRRAQLVALAARYAVPSIFEDREMAEVGGLLAYGASLPDVYRQAGVYYGGPGCLNNFSASISGASAGVRLPSGAAAS